MSIKQYLVYTSILGLLWCPLLSPAQIQLSPSSRLQASTIITTAAPTKSLNIHRPFLNTLAENDSPRDFLPLLQPAPASPHEVREQIAPYSSADLTPPEIGDNDRFGSTNVPMDSWIYPALERLAAMGFIPSQNVSIRPWTRQECLRQTREVEESLFSYNASDSMNEEAQRLLSDLLKELAQPEDHDGIVLESAYTRSGTIAGPALTDGFHFGQTWWNDFGRPLGRGSSVIAGFSARATHGRFFMYDRQELQQSPGALAITSAESQLFNTLDGAVAFGTAPANLSPPTPAISAYLRQRPIELYAGIAFAGNALSFGKQEIFWGPTTMGPWSFSSNAEPTYNLRLVSTRPHPYPFFQTLGTYKFDLVFGKLSGHKYPARPYFNGQKIDLTFGNNLEVSFTRWSILWGVGHPMTLRTLKDNLFSSNSTSTAAAGQYNYGDRTDPGDRKSDFDFRLHVPGLSKIVTLYADAYADDELNPIDAPRRVAWAPGIYLARLPYLPHMDLRFEMASSEELSRDEGGIRFFINNQYRDGNTNKGFLLGNAVGRDSRAFEGRTGYWLSARSRVEFGYRQAKGGLAFLPGGSTISDGFVNASYAFTPEWSAQLFAQHERFLIPSFMSGAQHNESGWLQITWNPKLHLPR
ncbi:capsule assembly Wzi family protein [Granulicella arctica]|uniref:capsule assembly Wzi family protein n=1 Tax=Granulicella arctica TaxID=940613 RepID=UPI0021DF797A|nr:capsule assembly Wzi family protein [Granulicella arctica]